MVLDLVLPRRCAVCRALGASLCGGCAASLRRIEPPLCARCGRPTLWPVSRCRECSGRRLTFASARAAVEYDDAARTFVAAWKEHGQRTLCAVAVMLVVEVVPRPRVDAIVAVPGDPERLLRRGDHPAESLARELAPLWNLPYRSPLVRPRSRVRQRGLTLVDRRRNVRDVFTARDSPRRVALVDDVYTTGATANAAASTLRRAGARTVYVVTFARALRRD